MRDDECVAFLQWALPQLGMRWRGFRKVRRQVCRRIARRLDELGLDGLDAYRLRLGEYGDEWQTLARLCRVTISRFYRDRGVFEHLGAVVLPGLARAARRRGDARVRCWSAGCGSGEESYSVALTWHFAVARRATGVEIDILGTDVDPHLLERAEQARYRHSSLRELPPAWVERAFERLSDADDAYRLTHDLRTSVRFACEDLRAAMPFGRFDLILCRNLVFTYFDDDWQERIAARFAERLHEGGVLVVGSHETVPPAVTSLEPASGPRGVYLAKHGR